MRTLLLVIIISAFPILLLAQKKAITESGDTIIVYPDYTWAYLNEKKMPAPWEPLPTIHAELKKDETDPFNNSRIAETKSWTNFADDGTLIGYMSYQHGLYSLTLVVKIGGCLNQYASKVQVKLTTGEIVEFVQTSDTNCVKSVQSATFFPLELDQLDTPTTFRDMNKNLNQLIKYDWVSMRVHGSNGYNDYVPIEKDKYDGAKFFREHLQALGYSPK